MGIKHEGYSEAFCVTSDAGETIFLNSNMNFGYCTPNLVQRFVLIFFCCIQDENEHEIKT